MAPLRIAAVETPHRFGDPDAALAAIDRALAALAGRVDVALLPECALTGYVSPEGDFDLSRFAETIDGPSARAVAGVAKSHGLSVACSLVERDGAARFNTLALFGPDGELAARWRKRHPWYPERWATPGDLGTPVVEHRGARLTACVCFDIHFIADDAPEALREADVMLFASAWVEDGPGDSRGEILPALARRFSIPIVNANWGRGDPLVRGQGKSRVVAASGVETLARRASGATFAVAEIDRRSA
ncbi:MAG: carbon-nitrogen hydrolase family protein [Polyangiales bacterium]